MDLVDQGVGNAAEAEAASKEGRVRLHIFEGFGSRRKHFVDLMSAEGGGEVAGEYALVLEVWVSM